MKLIRRYDWWKRIITQLNRAFLPVIWHGWHFINRKTIVRRQADLKCEIKKGTSAFPLFRAGDIFLRKSDRKIEKMELGWKSDEGEEPLKNKIANNLHVRGKKELFAFYVQKKRKCWRVTITSSVVRSSNLLLASDNKERRNTKLIYWEKKAFNSSGGPHLITARHNAVTGVLSGMTGAGFHFKCYFFTIHWSYMRY